MLFKEGNFSLLNKVTAKMDEILKRIKKNHKVSSLQNKKDYYLWHDQRLLIETQQSNQPELQITLQEVIGMIDRTAQEETRGDDVRHEETMTDDVRHEETMTDEMQQWFD